MSAKFAAFGASALSVCTVIGCVILVPLIYNKISSITDEMKLDMQEFNVSFNSTVVPILLTLKTNAVVYNGKCVERN